MTHHPGARIDRISCSTRHPRALLRVYPLAHDPKRLFPIDTERGREVRNGTVHVAPPPRPQPLQEREVAVRNLLQVHDLQQLGREPTSTEYMPKIVWLQYPESASDETGGPERWRSRRRVGRFRRTVCLSKEPAHPSPRAQRIGANSLAPATHTDSFGPCQSLSGSLSPRTT